MKKKIIMLTIVILTLLTISAVSATENNTNDIVSIDDANDKILNAKENQILEQTNLEIISEPDNGTFTALQNKINNADEKSIINLENDYNYNDGFDTFGILISKEITINGNGHTINATHNPEYSKYPDQMWFLKI